MNISDYQCWLREYDWRRGFDLVQPSQVVVHLLEELGEIAREVLYAEGYRDPSERTDAVGRLAEELADALIFLTKLANCYGIDLAEAVRASQAKAEARFPVEISHAETQRYLDHQVQDVTHRAAAWGRRGRSEGRADETDEHMA